MESKGHIAERISCVNIAGLNHLWPSFHNPPLKNQELVSLLLSLTWLIEALAGTLDFLWTNGVSSRCDHSTDLQF